MHWWVFSENKSSHYFYFKVRHRRMDLQWLAWNQYPGNDAIMIYEVMNMWRWITYLINDFLLTSAIQEREIIKWDNQMANSKPVRFFTQSPGKIWAAQQGFLVCIKLIWPNHALDKTMEGKIHPGGPRTALLEATGQHQKRSLLLGIHVWPDCEKDIYSYQNFALTQFISHGYTTHPENLCQSCE